jgi:hypothetical protein
VCWSTARAAAWGERAAEPPLERYELLRTVVVHTPDSHFARPAVGFESFDAGELIATDGDTEIRAPGVRPQDPDADARAEDEQRRGVLGAFASGLNGDAQRACAAVVVARASSVRQKPCDLTERAVRK